MFLPQTETQRDTRKPLELMDMSVTWIAVVVTGVYTYVPAHQVVCINYVQFLVQQSNFTKAWGKKEEQNKNQLVKRYQHR